MTQDVDTEQFYATGSRLFELAGTVYATFNSAIGSLAEAGSMAGTDDAGTAWATSYDARAAEILGAANDLTLALENYGGVVIQAGFNHAMAEHNATPNQQGPAPTKPTEPVSTASVVSTPPAAGGPGEGLIDNALGLVEQIGVPVPDGDTEKVDKAAGAWSRLATARQLQEVVESLGIHASTFEEVLTPEAGTIANDLGELRDGACALLDGCEELAQSCSDYKGHLDELRKELEGLLTNLAVELAVTATIAIATSFISFGAGAAAGAAKAAHSISKFAKMIKNAISAWKLSKKISDGVKRVHDIAGVRSRMSRLKNLGRRQKPEEPVPPPSRPGSMTVEGTGFSVSEREMAQEMVDRGHNVVLREANPASGRTSDLLVDGVPYDVYTPQTGNLDRLVSAIAKKGDQVNGGGIVVDLRNSPLTPEQVGDLLPRVQGITPQITDIIVIG